MLLKSTLTQVELECQAARSQVSALQRKLHALELEVEVCMAPFIYFSVHRNIVSQFSVGSHFVISINQLIFIYIRQPKPIVAKPKHVKRKKGAHTALYNITTQTDEKKKRN